MKKVLITGGAGFIGFHVAKRLAAEGYRLDLLDNFARGVLDRDLEELATLPGVRVLNRDLLRPDSLKDLDDDYRWVYHFAAIIGVAHVLARPFATLRDNVEMLVNTLSWSQSQKGLERLVFASTSEVYAGTLQYFHLPIPTPEWTPLAITDLGNPRTSYMLSKIYGEALCQQSGVPFTIVRPHNIYGPRMGMSHVIPELLQKAKFLPENDALEVFSVEHRRTFCYIEDGVEMIKRAAESANCERETLNIGTHAPEITIGALAVAILKIVGRNLKIVPQPATIGSPLRRCPDMSKTAALTGYVSRVGLEEGIGLTYRWYQDHIFSGKDIGAK